MPTPEGENDSVYCTICRGKFKKRGIKNHMRAAHPPAVVETQSSSSALIEDEETRDNSSPHQNLLDTEIQNLFTRAYMVPA